jgi:tetratricopeptide (TPR) repeat protein
LYSGAFNNSDQVGVQAPELPMTVPEPDPTADPPASGALTKSAVHPATVVGERSTALNPRAVSQGRYELGEEIARGGMGIVYRAIDTAFGREVAVKVLQEQPDSTSSAARRFADEARITGQLQHPAIPPAHDLGVLPDGRLFLAMKLIRGRTLDDLLKGRADLSADRGRYVAVFEQVCQALAYAHAHHVIHRDLKPANIMVGNFGDVQVMDWGLAKVLDPGVAEIDDPEATSGASELRTPPEADEGVTRPGSFLGTPAFMPPEQALGMVQKIGYRSDVFGQGAVLAVILTGKPPFAEGSAETARMRAAQGKMDECFARLDACGADPELVALCKRCLCPDPAGRPADAGAVAQAVAELRQAADERARRAELERVQAEGEKAAAELQAAEQRKRRRVTRVLAAVIGLLLIIGTGAAIALAAWALASAERARERTQQVLEEQQKTREALSAEVRRRMQARAALDILGGQVVEDLLARRTELGPEQRAFLQKALGLYQELVQDVGDDGNTLRGAADAAMAIARIQQRLAHLPESEAAYRMAIDLYRRLEQFATERSHAREGQGTAWNNLGNLLREMGRSRDAEDALTRALDFNAGTLSTARTRMNIALVRELNGDLPGAEKRYREVLTALAADEAGSPVSIEVLALAAACRSNLGSVLMTLGRPADAQPVLDKSVAAFRLLAAAKDPQHRSSLGKALHNLAGSLQSTGDGKGADKTIREAIAVERALVEEYPAVANYRADLSNHCDRLASFLRAAQLRTDAVPFARDAVRESERAAAGRPHAAELNAQEAGMRENLAALLAELGKFDEAEPEMRRAQACWARIRDPRHALSLPYSRLNMMHMLYDQHKSAEMIAESLTMAKELDAALEGPPSETRAYQIALYYARAASANTALMKRALAALRRCAAAGAFRQPDRLKELTTSSYFEAIRKHEEFRKLLDEITKL